MNEERIRNCNQKPMFPSGNYILYWMQAYRRFDSNHAFAYAVSLAKEQNKELIVYEGLRCDYPWNSERIHKFILEGMYDNQTRADELGINYWSFIESKSNPARGVLKEIAKNAVAIVTDDFPCFIIPEQINKLSEKINCPLIAVDSNSLLPLSRFERTASAARILRIWIHKEFLKGLPKFAKPKWKKEDLLGLHHQTKPPHGFGLPKDLNSFLLSLDFKEQVPPAKGVKGGRTEALKILKTFVNKKNTKL